MEPTVRDRIQEAREALVRAGLPPADASLDAEVLARHVLGWDRAAVLTRGEEPAPAALGAAYDAAIARRARREPVALIMGAREFWGLDFWVTPDVLIPRPETELIVESAIAIRPRGWRGRILDVGTGTGCLAIALAVEFPHAHVFASDLSSAALVVARHNATRHGLLDRIRLVRANLLDGLAGPFDLIASNPPYVPLGSPLPPDVVDHEPHSALFAGPDGLAALRPLIHTAADRLAPGGRFIVEFGFGQADEIRSLAAGAGWRDVEIAEDLQGIPRVAVMAR
jgi:release factor glutamine methyltransferase